MRLGALVIGMMWAGTSIAAEPERVRPDIKLGLWETTRTTVQSGAPAMDMSGLGPDQRAALEALKQKHAEAKPETNVTQACLTAEALDKDPFQDKDHPGTECQRTVLESTKKLQHVTIACTGARPRNGEMRLEVLSREKVKGKLKISSPGQSPDEDLVVTSSWTSKWLGAACGDVK